MPGMASAVRVTTDPEVFDYSSENHQLFSPGGQLFGAVQLIGTSGAETAEGDGICWMVTPSDRGAPQVFFRTRFGLQKVTTLAELEMSLRFAAPGPGPETAGGSVRRIA